MTFCFLLLLFEGITVSNTQFPIINNNHPYHHRSLLQQLNISCNWTYSDSNTCVIYAYNITNHSIECDPNRPNCEIYIGNLSNSVIHCPTNGCLSCVIRCTYSKCSGLTVHSNDCHSFIMSTSNNKYNSNSFRDSTIYAPRNGGILNITGSISQSNILSSPGTVDMNLALNGWLDSKNLIDAEFITGRLNVACSQTARCYDNNIICGSNDTECNINCTSTGWYRYGAGCNRMTVFAEHGTSQVHWYCDNSQWGVCVGAKLECGNISDPMYSQWTYDSYNAWHYQTGDCVQGWATPPISCTTKSDDTCYIIRQSMDESRTIQCIDELENCVVQLGDAVDDDPWSTQLQSIIHCPSSMDCITCIIQCLSHSACYGVTIIGYNCSTLEVNIRAFGARRATIYAPEGDLIIHANVQLGKSELSWSDIYSMPGTRNIIIELGQFNVNYLDGKHVTGSLNITCGPLAACSKNEIICPNDANCIFDCESTGDFWSGCPLNTVNATEGTHDVNWICNDRRKYSCGSSRLYCGQNYTQSSGWKYDDNNQTWFWTDHINGGCVDIPTIAPTPSPTIPTLEPTELTSSPSISPTMAYMLIEHSFLNEIEYVVIIGLSILIFLLILCGLVYYYKYYKIEKKSLYITNGIVILIGIGEYDRKINTDNADIDGHLADLGIDEDIKNMVHLFHDELNYDVYPSEYVDDIKKGYSPKLYWTEKELKEFLEERAKYLKENIQKYDGLIVIMSGHGIPRNICTSDYKTFSKIAIHRMFSSPYPESRDIPRLFLFDCCSGNNERKIRRDSDSEQDEFSKQVTLNDVEGDSNDANSWIIGDHNPDYRLAVIEAANYGFQSKLKIDTGSYVIHLFYKKMMDVETNNKRRFIYKIFDEIQEELHKKGKQHPTYVWNEDTRYIRFKRNKMNKSEAGQIEMETLPKNGKPEYMDVTMDENVTDSTGHSGGDNEYKCDDDDDDVTKDNEERTDVIYEEVVNEDDNAL